ncbi:MAG: DUF3368 domain-containing protein [Candidatus Riflebacteria bacterium]|nr:DUF3368 domain-containing protein [Candidatus Riflebacteria bacterium]
MQAKIISNTGPLIAFSIINKLEILRKMFDQVIVPEAVNAEILAGGDCFRGVKNYLQADWIKKVPLKFPVSPIIIGLLDLGEASVIQLAQEIRVNQVLIDERKGRKIAREIMKLNVFGSARILVEAKKIGLIENVNQLASEMRQAGYYLHQNIVDAVLKESGEFL